MKINWKAFFSIAVGTAIGIISIFIISIVIIGYWLFGDEQSTNIGKYGKLIAKLPPAMATHFPKTIPRDPQRVRFFYQNYSIGQGTLWQAELWMKLEPGEAGRLYSQFDTIKQAYYEPKHVYDEYYKWINPADKNEEDTQYSMGNVNLSLRLSYFHTIYDMMTTTTLIPKRGSPPRSKAPKFLMTNFVAFTLDTGNENGWTRGVVINRKDGEIIYFAVFSYGA